VVVVLLVLGAICVAVRASTRHEAPAVRGDTFWKLTYDIPYRAAKAGARLQAAFPRDTSHGRVHRINFPAAKSDQTRRTTAQAREVAVVAAQAGPGRITAEFEIHLSPRASWRSESTRANLTAEGRAHYLRSENGIKVDDPLVVSTLEKLQSDPASKVQLVDRLFDFCLTEIGPGGKEAPADAVEAIRRRVANPLGRARAMVALCRAAKVPARLVVGFPIKQGADIRPHVWLEAAAADRWEPFDPENDFTRELPHTFLPARRDGASVIHAAEMLDVHPKFSIAAMPPPEDIYRPEGQRLADVLDLTRLPLEMHEPLSVILLMPLGALLTCIVRTIIGVRTFGTFTPSLLALAFVYNDWRTGIVVFAIAISLGLLTRSFLDKLKLLLVPRLSVILTLVALCMVFGVSLLDYYRLAPSSQAVLLPMVIMTMTVERFFLTMEEDSPRFAAQLLVSTILVAACCYLVLRWETVGRWLLLYPEVHLFTIAAMILLGRYSGYRLTELWRFRDLADPEP
jgi:transglutaminase-like putative cysteine protease